MNYISILGVNLIPLTSLNEAYLYVKKETESKKPGYVTLNNVHTLVESRRQSYYSQVLRNSSLPLTDSQPLNIIFRRKGNKKAIRIFGPTLMESILETGQKDNLRHFFFGSTEETLNKLRQNINNRFPSANIAGMISPSFQPLTTEENQEYLDRINRCNADIIWVGLGAPKQEIWMYENYNQLNRGVMIGIGAGFNYLAGNSKHAPEWMKNMAIEWLYRLIQEPRRLWKRYLVTNSLFIIFLLLEFLHLKKFDD